MKKVLFRLAKSSVGELIVGIAFGKFSSLLPVERVMETDRVIAFWHPKPYWEEHLLIVPKKALKNLSTMQSDDFVYIEEMFKVAQKIVKEKAWEADEYTVVMNGGSRQQVAQLHFHLARGTKKNVDI